MKLPIKQQLIWKRQSVHALLGRLFSRVIIVVPMTSLFGEGVANIEKIGEKSGLQIMLQEMIDMHLKLLQELNIDTFVSPPENLKKLVREVKGKSVAVDLDVDYLEDFQEDCYTCAPRVFPEAGLHIPEHALKLGSMWQFLKFIKRVKPQLITISELKRGSFNKPTPSLLFRKLKDLRYKIETGNLLTDEEATKLLAKYEQYWKTQIAKIVAVPFTLPVEEQIKAYMQVTKRLATAISKFPSFMRAG